MTNTEIILQESVRNLGALGDIVKVKSGFARNFLIPHGIAIPATERNRELFEKRRVELEKIAKEKLAAAEKRAEQFKEIVLTLQRKTQTEDKLFGSVGIRDIAEALAEQGYEVEKKEIDLGKPIRQIGEYEVQLQLHSDITVPIKVIVEPEL